MDTVHQTEECGVEEIVRTFEIWVETETGQEERETISYQEKIIKHSTVKFVQNGELVINKTHNWQIVEHEHSLRSI